MIYHEKVKMVTVNLMEGYLSHILIVIIYLIKMSGGLSLSEAGVCLSSEPPKAKCCVSYIQDGNVCKACPNGTFGINCSQTCPVGSYGRLCLEECDCQDYQKCYPALGCQNSSLCAQREIHVLPQTTNPCLTTTTSQQKPSMKIFNIDPQKLELFLLIIVVICIVNLLLHVYKVLSRVTVNCCKKRKYRARPRVVTESPLYSQVNRDTFSV